MQINVTWYDIAKGIRLRLRDWHAVLLIVSHTNEKEVQQVTGALTGVVRLSTVMAVTPINHLHCYRRDVVTVRRSTSGLGDVSRDRQSP